MRLCAGRPSAKNRPLVEMPPPMQLHECAHRRLAVDPASGAMQIVCGLAQQILGLDRDTACQVDESVCARCGRLPAPTAALPNAVVASVVYNVSMLLVEAGRTP